MSSTPHHMTNMTSTWSHDHHLITWPAPLITWSTYPDHMTSTPDHITTTLITWPPPLITWSTYPEQVVWLLYFNIQVIFSHVDILSQEINGLGCRESNSHHEVNGYEARFLPRPFQPPVLDCLQYNILQWRPGNKASRQGYCLGQCVSWTDSTYLFQTQSWF